MAEACTADDLTQHIVPDEATGTRAAASVRKGTIYRSRRYDISSDENIVSRRWATREAIGLIGGEVLEDTATEVDRAVLVERSTA
jgi:hypothetical protein